MMSLLLLKGFCYFVSREGFEPSNNGTKARCVRPLRHRPVITTAEGPGFPNIPDCLFDLVQCRDFQTLLA